MDFLTTVFSETEVYTWDTAMNDWVFAAAIALLVLELIRLTVKKTLSWKVVGDTVTNFIVYYAFILIYYVLGGALYVAIFYYIYLEFSLFDIPITPWAILLCVLLADFLYYWEHRFSHRVGIGWATHTVHHSSPYFNMSVAFRFGPLDGLIPILFHLPLVFAGFNPLVIFFAEAIVLLYQTFLHTEVVGKLPRPVEAVLNTPSHHRVHHGSNLEYRDKNYGGILIIWDRMFGTFAEENEPVVYGITEPINSVNPLTVFFHGFTRLARQIWTARGWRSKFGFLVQPPDWKPDKQLEKPGPAE